MPFEAAEAIARTFCYPIRYALVPLFGPDFANECCPPGAEGFKQMIIAPNIIESCTRQAKKYAAMYSLSSGIHFSTPRYSAPESDLPSSKVRLRRPHNVPMLKLRHSNHDTYDHQSSVSTPPPITTSSSWASVNTPRRETKHQLATPRSLPAGYANNSDSDVSPKSKVAQKGVSPHSCDGNDHDSSMMSNASEISTINKATKTSPFDDKKAAYALLQLHWADTTAKTSSSKRRAST